MASPLFHALILAKYSAKIQSQVCEPPEDVWGPDIAVEVQLGEQSLECLNISADGLFIGLGRFGLALKDTSKLLPFSVPETEESTVCLVLIDNRTVQKTEHAGYIPGHQLRVVRPLLLKLVDKLGLAQVSTFILYLQILLNIYKFGYRISSST